MKSVPPLGPTSGAGTRMWHLSLVSLHYQYTKTDKLKLSIHKILHKRRIKNSVLSLLKHEKNK